MKRTILAVTALFTAGLVMTGIAAASGPVVVDRIVAIVNDDIITMSDLQREQALKQRNGMDDRALLEDMIDRKLQMTAAKRAGMDVTDKELSDAVDEIMKRNGMDVVSFNLALSKEGLTLDQYRFELREQMTLSRVFNKYVRAGLAVNEADVRAYYDRNKSAYALPEEVRVRQLLVPLPDNATTAQTAAAKAHADALYERLRKGEDFSRLVRDSGRKGDDGDLGFLRREDMLPEMEQAVQKLKPGEASKPFLASGGYRIVRAEEVRTPIKAFDKVKDEIMNSLYQQKVENTYRSWLQTLRGDSHIENKL